MKTYIFHRKEGWYTIDLKDDDDAIKGAIINVGTLKVTDIYRKLIWMQNEQKDERSVATKMSNEQNAG